ncbi:hypothetical protein MRB53_027455 [Persea americana]|uniref:Uncharacterized protein n=1 Tax=Persea americana TaxID=3435 RepID=A0ACC2LL17_PERAE|nr:hypothetical protein MRB53_027455 [Persea americana]
MENVRTKLLESKISGAKKYEVSFGSYRGVILDSSNEVEAAVSWIRTIQKKYAIHRREKGMSMKKTIFYMFFKSSCRWCSNVPERPIIFSSFQTDAAQLVRKLQCVYPVFFLTDGGSELYTEARMNSLDEAIKLSVACGLQGIVSEVRAIFRNPGAISKLKEFSLCLLTYGQLNNVPEAVYMQHLMGINGVIVDLVKEITEAVSDFTKPAEEGEGSLHIREGEGQMVAVTRPIFSQREPSFLLKLIPQLI